MRYKEDGGWIGEYEIIVTHQDGTTKKENIKNRITNAGLNMLRDGLNGGVTDLELKYLALGIGDTAINDTDTQLINEQFRTTFISTTKPGVGLLQKTGLVLDSEAVFNIKELAIFAGASATSTADTGIMVSRILYARDKTNLESIQFVRTDTIDRG